jgi:hypothetical protein
MANEYTVAIFEPDLPKSAFSDEELEFLEKHAGIEYSDGEDEGKIHLFNRESFSQDCCIDFDTEETFCILEWFQNKLRTLDSSYKYITIEGSTHTSKFYIGSHQGFAHVITRDSIVSMNTTDWVMSKIPK